MKKIAATILALLFILSSVTAVAAEGKAHRMNEANCEHESECSHPMDGDHDAHIEEAESAAAFADKDIQYELAEIGLAMEPRIDTEEAGSCELTSSQEGFRSGAPRIASEESKKLALTAIDKLIEGNQDLSGADMSSFSAERVYSRACWLAPEIIALEKRADGFLALLELYEEYAENACSYDWKALKQRRDRGLNDPGYAWRYEDPEGYKMKAFPQRIEGLFAQKPFFSKLDGSQQKRFFSALCYIYNTVTVPLEDYLDGTEDGCYAHFFFCGGGELLDEYNVRMENGKAVLKSLPTVTAAYLLTHVPDGNVVATGGTQIASYRATNELNDTLKSYYRTSRQDEFLNNQFVSEATSQYNCHSYAWYLRSVTNKKFIDNPDISNIINDFHCVRVTSSPQIGDIIVYKSGVSWNFFFGCSPKTEEWAHSGVVVSTNPIRVRSKWGPGCLWVHLRDDVPDDYKYNDSVEVRYYRYSMTHNSLSQYTYISAAKHRARCACGKYITEPHTFMPNSNICEFCGYHAPYKVDEPPALPSGKFELDL